MQGIPTSFALKFGVKSQILGKLGFCQKNRQIEGNSHYFDEFFFIREILIQNRILNINEKQAH